MFSDFRKPKTGPDHFDKQLHWHLFKKSTNDHHCPLVSDRVVNKSEKLSLLFRKGHPFLGLITRNLQKLGHYNNTMVMFLPNELIILNPMVFTNFYSNKKFNIKFLKKKFEPNHPHLFSLEGLKRESKPKIDKLKPRIEQYKIEQEAQTINPSLDGISKSLRPGYITKSGIKYQMLQDKKRKVKVSIFCQTRTCLDWFPSSSICHFFFQTH